MAAKTLKSLGLGQLLGMEERERANLLSADPAVIRRRQALFRELDEKNEWRDILGRLYESLKNIREMAQKRPGLDRLPKTSFIPLAK